MSGLAWLYFWRGAFLGGLGNVSIPDALPFPPHLMSTFCGCVTTQLGPGCLLEDVGQGCQWMDGSGSVCLSVSKHSLLLLATSMIDSVHSDNNV